MPEHIAYETFDDEDSIRGYVLDGVDGTDIAAIKTELEKRLSEQFGETTKIGRRTVLLVEADSVFHAIGELSSFLYDINNSHSMVYGHKPSGSFPAHIRRISFP